MPVEVDKISCDLEIQGDRKTYGMLHDNKVSLVFEWNTEISQECISRLTHNHCAEELTSKPSSATWGDRSFNDSNLEIGTRLPEHVGRAETARSSSDDNDVGFGIVVKILEVTTGHGTRDLRLADGSEFEAMLPLIGKLGERLGFAILDRECLDVEGVLQWNAVNDRLVERGGGWRHFGCIVSNYEPNLD